MAERDREITTCKSWNYTVTFNITRTDLGNCVAVFDFYGLQLETSVYDVFILEFINLREE